MPRNVTPSKKKYPRIHDKTSADASHLAALQIPGLTEAAQAVRSVTGVQLILADRPADGADPFFVQLPASDATAGDPHGMTARVETTGTVRGQTEHGLRLVQALAAMVAEIRQTRRELALRETELATHIPVVANREAVEELSRRLQAVLQGIAQGLECRAAAFYLLDEGTSALKLRAQWGLSAQALLEPPRALETEVADLEAMLGHAIVISDPLDLPHWNVPAPCSAAVCVPVSTSTTLLGTLWLFSDLPRDFSSQETNLIEIAAGRLAGELERSVLLGEVQKTRQAARDDNSLAHWQQTQQQLVAPQLDGWAVCGVLSEGQSKVVDFFDWQLLYDDRLAVAVGGTDPRTDGPMLQAAAMRAALQSEWLHGAGPEEILDHLNQIGWRAGTGDGGSAMWAAELDPASGMLTWANAGQVDAYVLRPHGWEPLEDEAAPLGADPDQVYLQRQTAIAPGDILIAISDSGAEHAADNRQIAETLLHHTHLPIDQLASMAAAMLKPRGKKDKQRAILIVQRQER